MENSFQKSFIPKKPAATNPAYKKTVSFFSIITISLLIISILASLGLFFYKKYLTKQIETLSSSLNIARDSFETDTIKELDLFSKRTESAKTILKNHIVLSPLFSLLGEITIPQVAYTSFDAKIDENGVTTVNVNGMAKDYRSISVQSDVFSSQKGSSLKNILFANLVKDKDSNVSFNLKFNVTPSLLSYEKNSLLEENTTSFNNLENATP
jgi:hypothetical protein